ncbi:chalcone isomerase family protein [Eleftheria terrae]|uniref:chalcone isomerase family protein n=1 Tax=Eleftheria terrae TaxID=1597781 RepID=UPI00263AD22F|nr:chalcone isomerase family protein [Eleftheria terrae]WKB50597.1 chalcone isomerase family protein [Eleftheria terrae]
MLFAPAPLAALLRACALVTLAAAAGGVLANEPTASTPAAAASAGGIEVEGFRFDAAAQVAGQNLVLNGAGLSSILSAKSTAVAFYLPAKQTTMEAALAVKGPKRIQYFMVRDVSARDLSNALLDRIRQNNSSEEFTANIVQTSQLGAVFGTRKELRKSDMVTIDWMPATQTTEFRLNGERVGELIKGESFYQMMMKVWIGPRVRASTRNALLGQPG